MDASKGPNMSNMNTSIITKYKYVLASIFQTYPRLNFVENSISVELAKSKHGQNVAISEETE